MRAQGNGRNHRPVPRRRRRKLRKELELKKARQKATSIIRPDESMKLDTAVEVFIREREDLNPDSARRWRLELDLFKEQSGKVYLCELTRAMVHLLDVVKSVSHV